MNQIKALIHELHHRSVWQVLLVFVGAGWAVLEVIDTFIERGLLPDWTFNGAVLVLLLGLPVVLATAFVQEGVSSPKEEDRGGAVDAAAATIPADSDRVGSDLSGPGAAHPAAIARAG
jgi:hypothetical protein